MANYNPYNTNFYLQDLQNMRDRIDRTIQQYHQNQIQQPQVQPPITQNFQLAPTQLGELEARYANNIEEVKNTFVIKTGIFITKDFSTIWIKDTTGNIKTYKTEEIIELDEKDKTIALLQKQIDELKGVMMNATNANTNVDDSTTTKKSTRVSNNTKSDAE